MSSPPEGSDGPVITTVTRRVRPGHEFHYERFLEGINAAASGFPGHLGVEVFRPRARPPASTGLETWFTLPVRPATPPPPPYKMAQLTRITILPLITHVVIAQDPLLEGLSRVPRLAITTAVTVPIMTWLVMPRVTRLLRRWLYPRG